MRSLRSVMVVLPLLILSFVLPGAAQGESLHVVATYSILGDLVQNIAGDMVELTVLVGPDGDSHVYEPTPQDAVVLAEADLIFENGLNFETWLDDLYTASGSTAARIVVSDGIEPLEAAEGELEDDHAAESTEATPEAEEDHNHGEFDPHIWHDPNNAVVMVENIRAALVAADPTNADTYNANTEAYTDQLTDLDTYIREQIATLPQSNRILVTSHDTFGYFGDEYGFTVMAVLESLTTEAADPSAGELAALITEIQSSGVPAIFTENITNPDLVEQVAAQAAVMVAPHLYTDALGQAGTPGATYLEMLRYNVDTITAALQ